VWDDGESAPVELRAESTTDIEGMQLGAIVTGTSTRSFDTAGEHTGELHVKRDGEVVATASTTVTVDDGSDGSGGSGDGDQNGSGDDGDQGDQGDSDGSGG